jgi:uncharacterized protein (TIGR02246 family)
MTRDDILALFARRQEAWSRHDAAALAADHAPEGSVHSATAGFLQGREKIERVYHAWLRAFPDLVFTSEELVVDGDRCALIWKATGTQTGEFLGVTPTGRRFEVTGVFIYHLKDGLILHERRILDFTGVLVQIGVLKAKPA